MPGWWEAPMAGGAESTEPEGPPRVRVVIADDDRHFRRGLKAVLETDPRVEVVGDAADGVAVVEVAERVQPDVVLLDVRMPGSGGVDAVAAVRQAVPNVAILMLTVSDERVDMAEALRAGAIGYLLKDRTLHEVADAVCSAGRGEPWGLG
jgi:two-component system NarL family response regulator